MMRIFSTGGKMDTQAVITHIVRWLDEYAAQANAKGFVVGVSGGIDSAVVSTLAARTGRTTLLLDMPIRQHPGQLERARRHIRNLQGQYANVSAQTANLTDTFQTFEQTVGVHRTVFANQPLSLANARSRLRMLTLYYYGQIHGLLVTGTGNKVEDFGVGFFTKYGDGGVDISPIADLTKTQVYRLAEALGVDEAIQKAPPTDGLWDTERTDEEQMGASYPELEWAMGVYGTRKPEDFEGRRREVLEIYTRLHRAMQHKINPIPVCRIPPELLG
ncbi:NAD(+) synthase [Neisseria gonorrhoeae]